MFLTNATMFSMLYTIPKKKCKKEYIFFLILKVKFVFSNSTLFLHFFLAEFNDLAYYDLGIILKATVFSQYARIVEILSI